MRAAAPNAGPAVNEMTVQRLVREVPHSLDVLRGFGVAVDQEGCTAIGEIEGVDAGLASALTRWIQAEL